MKSFTQYIVESNTSFPDFASERDRIRREFVAAAVATGMSKTQAEKAAKIEVARWQKTAGASLHSAHKREKDEADRRGEEERVRQQADGKVEIARLLTQAQEILRKAGFKSERRSQGGSESRYYTRGNLRVRLSDHEVPMTAEREHNRSLRGSPWTEFIFANEIRNGKKARPQGIEELRDWLKDHPIS